MESVYNMVYYRCRNILRVAKRCPSLLVRSVFCGAESAPWCFFGNNHIFGHRHIKISDIVIAYLIREIRSDDCFVPGFDSCELEFMVGQASTI